MPRVDAMSDLASEHCQPCSQRAVPLDAQQLATLMPLIPAWHLVQSKASPEHYIERVFAFKNFVEAQAFANRVGVLAEQENHHPAMLLEWGRLTVRWWTHTIAGLHRNDVILAAKTDALFER